MGWWLARRGMALAGFHHRNYRVRLRGGTQALLRTPRRQRYRFDPTMWPEEASILEALNGHVSGVPRVLGKLNGARLHSFTPGEALADRRQQRGVPKEQIHAWLAAFFTELACARVENLPARPEGWPPEGDSRGFLMAQVRYVLEEVVPPVLRSHGTLLRGLSFPDDAMERFKAGVPPMTRRPFMLLHGDLHAGNIILAEDDGTPRLIDWELAMIGDPLHDLAMHLERFGYRKQRDRTRVQEIWETAVGAVRPEAVAGLKEDLPWYIRFQRVRSVYVDVVRTCDALDVMGEKAAVERLVEIVGRALPLIGERSVPTVAQAQRALVDWRRSRWRTLVRG
jgi:aminoglycoside phosphotransferase (APT) family kinase protein